VGKELVWDEPVYISYNNTGDVNLDGTVDISDIVAVINAIAGDSTYSTRSDVNQDGQTDISDIVSIINCIAEDS
jgi:biopolymer transport protein ExbD